MTTEAIITFIEAASIVVGATFGILGTATDTKDKAGRLTRWGKIAIGGIIITNSFSLINNYFKQQKERQSEIISQRKENETLEEQNKRYREQLNYLTSILGKVDTSLTRVGENLEGQKHLIRQSKQLSNEQRESLNYILGTGYPIVYMKYLRDTTGTYEIVNPTNYPMYDVRIYIYERVPLIPEFNINKQTFEMHKQWHLDKTIDNINIKGPVYSSIFNYPFKKKNIIFYVSVSTRNGNYNETVLFRKRNDKYNVGILLYRIPYKKPFYKWVSSDDFYNEGEKRDLEKIINFPILGILGN